MTREFGDRPGDEVVEVLYEELSEELGTDRVEVHTRPDPHLVGRLVQDDEGFRPDTTAEEVARDSHDTSDLSAEESAMHFEDDGGFSEEFSADVQHDLEQYG